MKFSFTLTHRILCFLVFAGFLRFVLHRPMGHIFGPVWDNDHIDQAWFDKYSFTHLTHGTLLCILFPAAHWEIVVLGLEMLWEIVENSPAVVAWFQNVPDEQYRYMGDTVINSIGDCLCCLVGFHLAYYLFHCRRTTVSWHHQLGWSGCLDLCTWLAFDDALTPIVFRSTTAALESC